MASCGSSGISAMAALQRARTARKAVSSVRGGRRVGYFQPAALQGRCGAARDPRRRARALARCRPEAGSYRPRSYPPRTGGIILIAGQQRARPGTAERGAMTFAARRDPARTASANDPAADVTGADQTGADQTGVGAGYGGTDRWIVTGALFGVGGCYFVTAAGLSGLRWPARLLLMVAGLSSIGIAASPEPVHGSTPEHVAWAVLGAVAIAVWPAFVTRPAATRPAARPLILNASSCVAVAAVFLVLLGWLFVETQGGADLGLAERLTSGVQTSWPFIAAVALRRSASLSGPPAPNVPADACPADTEASRRRAGCRT